MADLTSRCYSHSIQCLPYHDAFGSSPPLHSVYTVESLASPPLCPGVNLSVRRVYPRISVPQQKLDDDVYAEMRHLRISFSQTTTKYKHNNIIISDENRICCCRNEVCNKCQACCCKEVCNSLQKLGLLLLPLRFDGTAH